MTYCHEDPSWSSDRLPAFEIVEWGLKLTQGMCWFAFFFLSFQYCQYLKTWVLSLKTKSVRACVRAYVRTYMY